MVVAFRGPLGRARCGRSLLDGGRVPGAVRACLLWKVPTQWWSRSGGRWGVLAVEGPCLMVVAFLVSVGAGSVIIPWRVGVASVAVLRRGG